MQSNALDTIEKDKTIKALVAEANVVEILGFLKRIFEGCCIELVKVVSSGDDVINQHNCLD